MKVFFPYVSNALLFGLLILGNVNLAAEHTNNRPLHHTDSGFKNNYLPEERMSKSLGTVFKWRFTRNSQEKVKFDSVEPDIEFLKSNKNEETLALSLIHI